MRMLSRLILTFERFYPKMAHGMSCTDFDDIGFHDSFTSTKGYKRSPFQRCFPLSKAEFSKTCILLSLKRYDRSWGLEK